MTDIKIEEATFGSGCFWCTEAVYQSLNGVVEVLPGYSGGDVINPSYREVCTGRTGHAEVLRVRFDPTVISYAELLEVFFRTHDPTTLNRQGGDVGTQYRSVIFYHDEEQEKLARVAKAAADKIREGSDPVVTAIEPLKNFFLAEPEHRDYYLNNPDQTYCRVVIRPKVEKFREAFSDLLAQEPIRKA